MDLSRNPFIAAALTVFCPAEPEAQERAEAFEDILNTNGGFDPCRLCTSYTPERIGSPQCSIVFRLYDCTYPSEQLKTFGASPAG